MDPHAMKSWWSAAPVAAGLALQPLGATPADVAVPSGEPVQFRVAITAGDHDERFVLRAASSPFGRALPGNGTNPAMEIDARPAVEGPAVLGASSASDALTLCGTGDTPAHGTRGVTGNADELLVPAGTRSVLTYTAHLAPDAPWLSTHYDLVLEALPRLLDGTLGTLPAPLRVVAPGPRPKPGVLRGVEISWRSSPAAAGGRASGFVALRRGRPITFTGSTRPVRRHAELRLVRGRGTTIVERVTTDADGRFRMRVARPAPGQYHLALPPSAGFAAERTCSIGVVRP